MWIQAFARAPILTSIGTLGIAAVVFWAQVTGRIPFQHKQTDIATIPYEEQIEALDRAEDSLRQVLPLIDDQKRQLRETKQAVKKYSEEKEELERILEVHRSDAQALVEPISELFDRQAVQAREAAIRERWIGFSLGVAASIMATLVVTLFMIVRDRFSSRQNFE